jgi:hypothetical protein
MNEAKGDFMIKTITLTAKPRAIRLGCDINVSERAVVKKPYWMVVETDKDMFIVSLALLEKNLKRLDVVEE